MVDPKTPGQHLEGSAGLAVLPQVLLKDTIVLKQKSIRCLGGAEAEIAPQLLQPGGEEALLRRGLGPLLAEILDVAGEIADKILRGEAS
jgi:hypothetical protein